MERDFSFDEVARLEAEVRRLKEGAEIEEIEEEPKRDEIILEIDVPVVVTPPPPPPPVAEPASPTYREEILDYFDDLPSLG